jgi:hypothetical protein
MNKDNNEFFELEKILNEIDFSKHSNKESVFENTVKKINEYKERNNMKNNRIKSLSAVAASLAVVCLISIPLAQTSFAKDLFGKIIKSISLGHVTVMQMEPAPEEKAVNPDNQKLGVYRGKDGSYIRVGTSDDLKDLVLKVTNIDEICKYASFKVILPGYLPKGYKFDRAELYKDENGNVSGKYVSLYFNNAKTGKSIYMQQRIADKETGYTASTDGNIEKIKINSADAVLSDNTCIEWEADNTIYVISSKDIGKDELIKTAESIK